MTDATIGAKTAYPSETPELTPPPAYSGVRVTRFIYVYVL